MTDVASKPTEAANTADSAAPAAKAKSKPKLKSKLRAKGEREQSTISFPYQDLDSAITVAKAMIGAGGVPVTREQLAGVMNLAVAGGNFVMKVATARIFGLIAYNQGKYELTNTGFGVVDSDERRQRAARAEAFLSVELYRRVYEEFRGKQLPPRPFGLEQAFIRFGVAQKQKSAARIAFEKSARQANFYNTEQDRLVEPIIGIVPPTERPRTAETIAGTSGESQLERSQPDTSAFHPFVQGLLDTLPEPNTNWTVEGRAKWLQAAANIFDLIYKGSGEITITSKSATEKG